MRARRLPAANGQSTLVSFLLDVLPERNIQGGPPVGRPLISIYAAATRVKVNIWEIIRGSEFRVSSFGFRAGPRAVIGVDAVPSLSFEPEPPDSSETGPALCHGLRPHGRVALALVWVGRSLWLPVLGGPQGLWLSQSLGVTRVCGGQPTKEGAPSVSSTGSSGRGSQRHARGRTTMDEEYGRPARPNLDSG